MPEGERLDHAVAGLIHLARQQNPESKRRGPAAEAQYSVGGSGGGADRACDPMAGESGTESS